MNIRILKLLYVSFFVFTINSPMLSRFGEALLVKLETKPATLTLSSEKIASVCSLLCEGGEKKIYIGHPSINPLIYLVYNPFWKQCKPSILSERKRVLFRRVKNCFFQELDILNRCKACENIIDVYGYDPKTFIMIVPKGIGDLFELLTSHSFSIKQKMKILKDIVNGIAYLHEMNIVHCDLKPDNIVLFEKNVAKLIDLSFSCLDGIERKFIVGTLSYFPPEHFKLLDSGKAYIVKKSDDIYALGHIINFLINGSIISLNEFTLRKILKKGYQPAELRENSIVGLNDLIIDCWDFDPENRPTIEDVSLRLDSIYREIRVQRKSRKRF